MYLRYFDLQCPVPSVSPGVWRCRACRSGRRGDSSPCPPPAPAPGPCRPPPGSGAEQPPVLFSISDDVIYGRTPSISQELTYGCDGKHEAARGEHGDHDQCPVPVASVPPGQRSDGDWWGHHRGQLATAVTAIHTEVVSRVVVDFRYRNKFIYVFLRSWDISPFSISMYI